MGKEGGSTGYSLNTGTTGDNIYMHITTASTWKHQQPSYYIDNCKPQGTAFYVSGWAYDPDEPDISCNVHVTLKRNGTDYKTVDLTTDILREDVNSAKGITGKHGFSTIIPIEMSGNFDIEVIAAIAQQASVVAIR